MSSSTPKQGPIKWGPELFEKILEIMLVEQGVKPDIALIADRLGMKPKSLGERLRVWKIARKEAAGSSNPGAATTAGDDDQDVDDDDDVDMPKTPSKKRKTVAGSLTTPKTPKNAPGGKPPKKEAAKRKPNAKKTQTSDAVKHEFEEVDEDDTMALVPKEEGSLDEDSEGGVAI